MPIEHSINFLGLLQQNTKNWWAQQKFFVSQFKNFKLHFSFTPATFQVFSSQLRATQSGSVNTEHFCHCTELYWLVLMEPAQVGNSSVLLPKDPHSYSLICLCSPQDYKLFNGRVWSFWPSGTVNTQSVFSYSN